MTAALAAALALVLTPGATAQPGPDTDLERVPESVTGVPGPAGPAPGPTVPSPMSTRAQGVPDATVAARLQSRSQSLVPTFGGRVTDIASGSTVWSRGGPVGMRPASATKVLTGYSALTLLGPDHRYETTVVQSSSQRDHVYLKGSGDPTMTTARLGGLANSTASAMQKQGVRTVTLRVDDTLFPTPTDAVGWQPGDVPTYVAPVRALVVDQKNSMDTSMQAAGVYADALRANGISVRSVGRAKAPSTARPVAARTSPVLRTIVADMLRVSQNDYAEALLWTSSLAVGGSKTWSGTTWRLRTTVGRYGVPTSGMRLNDGSGLSRSNRISAASLTALSAKLYSDPAMRPIFFSNQAMPVSGQTGTLQNRFRTWPSSCAVGRVRAKTGSLRETTVLTGVAVGTDGRARAFALLSNGRENDAALRKQLDELAATAVTCM